MATKFDVRQCISHDVLDQMAGLAGKQADELLRSINAELTMPLRMTPASTPDLTVGIGSITVANPTTGRNRTIPHISNVLPAFTSGTVTFPSASGGNITFSTGGSTPVVLTCPSGQYVQVVIYLTSGGNLGAVVGTANAVLANASVPPSASGTFTIGYVTLHNTGGVIDNVTGAMIYQFVGGGGGGGGTGNASSILETLKNQFVDSPYQLLTPNIIASDAATKFSAFSGAAFDQVNNVIGFTANSQSATSINLLDSAEFLTKAQDVGSVDLSLFWNKGTNLQAYAIPTGFTYQISRDGGVNWFPVTMERIGSSETFKGSLRFDTSTTTESVKTAIHTQAVQDSTRTLTGNNVTMQQKISQAFAVMATQKLQEVKLYLSKNAGTPVGNLFVSIVKNNGTVPSTNPSDVVAQSNAISISSLGLTGTPTQYTIDIPDVVLVSDFYHVVISTDAAYKAGHDASSNNSVAVGDKQVSPTGALENLFDGTTWSSAPTPGNMTLVVNGRTLDLRVRITSAGSPTYPCGLDGFGIFYNLQDVGVVGGVRKTQRFTFNSVSDNFNTFAITAFTPDPDLLSAYCIETGQVFKAPAFYLNGGSVVFPANTFNNGGVSTTYNLIFDQNSGGTFDNSDANARLLAGNFLGSTNANLDRSVAGRGIFLRRPDGTLREICIDNSDNIVIYSV